MTSRTLPLLKKRPYPKSHCGFSEPSQGSQVTRCSTQTIPSTRQISRLRCHRPHVSPRQSHPLEPCTRCRALPLHARRQSTPPPPPPPPPLPQNTPRSSRRPKTPQIPHPPSLPFSSHNHSISPPNPPPPPPSPHHPHRPARSRDLNVPPVADPAAEPVGLEVVPEGADVAAVGDGAEGRAGQFAEEGGGVRVRVRGALGGGGGRAWSGGVRGGVGVVRVCSGWSVVQR